MRNLNTDMVLMWLRTSGLFNMELQAVMTIFVVNMKRIIALLKQK